MLCIHMVTYEQHWCTIRKHVYAHYSLDRALISLFQRVLADSGNFLWVTLSAAIVSLVSLIIVMLAFRSSPTNFETEMAVAFSLLRQCLAMSLRQMEHGVDTTAADVRDHQILRERLLSQSIKLNETYSQAAFELRIGRINCKTNRIFECFPY